MFFYTAVTACCRSPFRFVYSAKIIYDSEMKLKFYSIFKKNLFFHKKMQWRKK